MSIARRVFLAPMKALLRRLHRKRSQVAGPHAGTPSVRVSRTISSFHDLYYGVPSRTWQNTYWLGTPTSKCPLDLWVYQEIISDTRPDLIIESGTYRGGSALFLAGICDALNRGRVISIDIEHFDGRPAHTRLRYLAGSSVAKSVLEDVRAEATRAAKVLVILDSDHSKAHVAAELEAYAPMVSVGSYLIVEDTNVNGHPVLPKFGPGPMEAVEEFLKSQSKFVRDEDREKFMMTFNPGGFLRRVS